MKRVSRPSGLNGAPFGEMGILKRETLSTVPRRDRLPWPQAVVMGKRKSSLSTLRTKGVADSYRFPGAWQVSYQLAKPKCSQEWRQEQVGPLTHIITVSGKDGKAARHNFHSFQFSAKEGKKGKRGRESEQQRESK